MAVDSRQKRASALLVIRPYVIAPPLPDGTVETGDRFQIAWMYGSSADAGGATPWTGLQSFGRGFGRRIGGFRGFFFGR